jgi:hypothetical protein
VEPELLKRNSLEIHQYILLCLLFLLCCLFINTTSSSRFAAAGFDEKPSCLLATLSLANEKVAVFITDVATHELAVGLTVPPSSEPSEESQDSQMTSDGSDDGDHPKNHSCY